MVLGFKKKFPWGAETHFKEKILACLWVEQGDSPMFPVHPKMHTCVEDKRNRWGSGARIHFKVGFDKFYEWDCKGTQRIKILPSRGDGDPGRVIIDDWHLSEKEMDRFARNEGFDSLEDFWKWFSKDFSGKIIHWTKLRYDGYVKRLQNKL